MPNPVEKPPQEKKPLEAKPPFKGEAPAVERRILTPDELLKAMDVLRSKIATTWSFADPHIIHESEIIIHCDTTPIPGFGSEYTLVFPPIGTFVVFNSSVTSEQIIFAMLLSGHPLVMKLLEDDVTPETFDPGPLREAQVLANMKILDLGCGEAPTFARVARCLGGDVYTVDIIPADMFQYMRRLFSEEKRDLEASKHIQLDLRSPDAAEKIIQASGGQFDLVTESHLKSGWSWKEFGDVQFGDGEKLAMKFLKKGGIHFNGNYSKITLCE